MPTFSIITVTRNAEKTLPRTLQSVAEQSFPDFEYIIIDGKSTDKTIKIITNYELRITKQRSAIANYETTFDGSQLRNNVRRQSITNKFRYISEEDSGLYDAMNKGLKLATGDYVCFLNAGDTFHSKDTLQEIFNKLSIVNCQLSIIYGETDIVDETGIFISHRHLKVPETLTWKSFRMGMLVSHQAFFVKREIAPMFNLQYRYSSDFDWCIRCMKAAKNILNTNLILINYLNEGITTANRTASLKERFKIMAHYYGWLPTALRHLWFAVRFYFL